nr:MAG: putative movement protein [Corparint virus 1]
MKSPRSPPVPRDISAIQTLIDQGQGPTIMNPNRLYHLSKIPINRDDYSKLSHIKLNSPTIFTITGPTGCGKSTFALLHLLPGRRMIILCPSKANAANLLTEFNQRIPDTIRKLNLTYFSPSAGLANYRAIWNYEDPVLIMTNSDFVTFVTRHHCFPPCHYLVMDEYHLQNRASTEARMIIMNCRSIIPGNNPTFIFISATPPDEPVPPPRLKGITQISCPVPDILSLPVPDIYRRSKHRRYSNNYLLIIADSCESAHILTARLRDLQEEVFCCCACPSPATVASFLRKVMRDCTVICTPDTESGMTFPCSHMVNPGTSVTTTFKHRIAVNLSTTLSQAQATQRAGRAGRIGHTLLFSPPLPENAPPLQNNPITLASAFLLCTALTRSRPSCPESLTATQLFPRLNTTSPQCAINSLAYNPPLLGLYAMDPSGTLYSELGGTATTFATDNSADLTLFKWPGGSAYSPFLNTLADHDLTRGMTPQLVTTITQEIARKRMIKLVDVQAALITAEEQPTVFAPYLWNALSIFDGPPNLSIEVTKDAPLHDFSGNTRTEPAYMLSQNGHHAWRILETLGGKYTLTTKRSHPPGPTPLGQSIDQPHDFCHRTFSFNGASFQYNSSKLLTPEGFVDPTLVTNALAEALTPVMITQAVLKDPASYVDLSHHSSLFARSANSWLNSLPL